MGVNGRPPTGPELRQQLKQEWRRAASKTERREIEAIGKALNVCILDGLTDPDPELEGEKRNASE